MPSQRALLYGLCLILFVAPLRFGAVEPAASAALTGACLLLGILWVVDRCRRGLPALPWREPLLLAGALLASLGVVQMIAVPRAALSAISPGAVTLRDRYEPARDATPAAGAAAAPAGDALTAADAPGPAGATEGSRPISLYPWATRQATLRLLACVLAALMALDLAAQSSLRRALAAALVAGGGFQAIYGLAEYFSGRQQIFGYVKKYYTDVATGTFINRNHFAGYLEMTLPLAVALSAIALSRVAAGAGPLGQRLAEAPGRRLFGAGVLLILALTMATALVCSRSRMGIASMVLALSSVAAILVWRGRGRNFAAAAIIVAGATLLIFGQGEAIAPIADRFVGVIGEFNGSLGRREIWSQAIGLVRAFPLAGVGLGVFPHVFSAFRTSSPGVFLDHAHSDFLEFEAEGGLLGCMLAAIAAVLVARSLRRGRAAASSSDPVGYACVVALAALGYHSITDFNLAIPSNALTLSVVAGMLVAWRRAPAPVLAIDHDARRPWRLRSIAPAGALAALSLVALAPLAAEAAERGDRARGGLDETPAGRLALLVDGDDADRLLGQAGRIGATAMTDLEILAKARSEGVEASPETLRYLEGRVGRAIRLQSLGLRQRPTSPQGHVEMGQLKLGRCAVAALARDEGGDCAAEAMPEFRAALALGPMSAPTHAQVARILTTAWPILSEDERAESQAIAERAALMNPDDEALRSDLRAMGGP